jgi:2-methylcitrate dehydratase PrpD
MALTRELSRFVAKTGPRSVPKRLLGLAKRYALDTIGAAAYGSVKPWSRIVAARGRRTGLAATGGAVVIGAAWKATAPVAALVNGAAGHAFELDDVHDESLLHPGAVVVPAALAVAEAERASGLDFLLAVVMGYEAMGRAGLAVGHVRHMLKGFHPTGTSGVFGAAAATGRLLRLDEERMAHALGVAGSMASGLCEFSQSGGMVKRLHAGRAAEGGVQAAYLAADGLTGPTAVLEGKYGYLACYGDKPEPEQLTRGLGARWMIDEITVKPYACCSDLHAIIDALHEIKAAHAVDAARVARVLVESTTKVKEQNVLDGTRSVMAAQYSAPFAVAAALLADAGDPRIYTEETLADPAIGRLQGKVEVRSAKEFDDLYARVLGARVTVTMDDGRAFAATVKGARGSVQRPLSQAEVEAKFLTLARGLMADGVSERIVALVAKLDEQPTVAGLARLLRGPFAEAGRRRRPRARAAA